MPPKKKNPKKSKPKHLKQSQRPRQPVKPKKAKPAQPSQPPAEPKGQETKTPSSLQGAGKVFYRVLVVLAALIVGLWGIYTLSARRPTTAEPPTIPNFNLPAATDDPTTTDVDESQQTPAPTFPRKDSTWTFLLCAQDQVSGNTDTIMVCTYDTVNQKIGLVSIPRDTFVIREGYRYYKINAAYAAGGIKELMGAVSQTLGIPIDHYVRVNTKIFVDLIDAVDGVDFNVPVHMSYDDPAQDLHIHYEPGLQHLTGKQALEVVRCRMNSDGKGEYPHNLYDAYPDADIGRTRTQQALIKAIAQKVLANPQKITSYAEIFFRHVKTDLTLGNLLWFAPIVLQFDFDDLTTATLPGDGNVTYKGTTYLYALDKEKSLKIINDCLNPYTVPVTENMVYMPQGN